jgi:hypothetical protein
METVTKPGLRATDRLRQTIGALAKLLDQTMNDIQKLDSEFQERIQQAVHEVEAALKQQASDRLKSAAEEVERNTRGQVTEQLQARFDKQLAGASETARNELANERALHKQTQDRLKQATGEWEKERAQLLAESKRAQQLLEQSRDEHSRAMAETDEAAAIALERQIVTAVDRVRSELTEKWKTERVQLVAERNRAQQRLAEADSEHERQLSESVNKVRSQITDDRERLKKELEKANQTSTQLELERNRFRDESEQLRVQAEANAKQSKIVPETLHAEVARVEGLIKDISHLMEDPETELSIVIRKNAERAELESYLRGLRFAIGSK